MIENMRFDKNNYKIPPLWVMSTLLSLGSMLRGVHQYPLADKSNSLSCRPLLFLSPGRSGTTLLRSMLVAGKSIAIPPEAQIFHALAVKFNSMQRLHWNDITRLVVSKFESNENFDEWGINLAPAYQAGMNIPEQDRSLARLIDEVFKTYAAQQFPEARIWGDQSPIHTVYLPWIYPVFPNARYLHLMRDGRDVIASYLDWLGADVLETVTQRWKISVQRVRDLQEQVRPGQFLEIRYEQLVTQPEDVLRKVSAFAGIEYNPMMLDYYKLPTTIENHYLAHHRNLSKPVFTTSMGRWKERLNREQQSYVLTHISPLLQELGYLD